MAIFYYENVNPDEFSGFIADWTTRWLSDEYERYGDYNREEVLRLEKGDEPVFIYDAYGAYIIYSPKSRRGILRTCGNTLLFFEHHHDYVDAKIKASSRNSSGFLKYFHNELSQNLKRIETSLPACKFKAPVKINRQVEIVSNPSLRKTYPVYGFPDYEKGLDYDPFPSYEEIRREMGLDMDDFD
jgi:hypothetical protein